MDQAPTTADRNQGQPKVNEITLDHPWEWLGKGWKDLTAAPKLSLAYGSVFMLLSYLLTLGLVYEGLFFIIPPLAAGFFLVAPLLGIGLYQISASLERGEKVQFVSVVEAWRRNEVHLSALAVVVVLVALAWMLVALLVFALFYDQPIPTWENFIPEVFLSGNSPVFLFSGILAGALIAGFTFSISVVSTPMLMDRQVDVLTAMQTSMRAVRVNWQAMILWASLIVMFVGVGIITFYIGLIVCMPLIGHATWHAYRDLVPDEGTGPIG
ncbi:MAG: DUF2189 domain-containing protein [Chromatiaceae bacterium]|jgi:uncharacterized membrane protein|nr:DUF2189 domain-containing protein [Chromatiaceae bacterium]